MQTDIAKTDPRDIQLRKARLHETGIEFQGELTAEEWEDLGVFLERTRNGHKWWIGDWLVYGQLRQDRWGHKYEQALSTFPDYSYDELREFASVAEGVPPEVRREGVSWSAHAAVRTLPRDQQQRLLSSKATVQEIRREVKALKKSGGNGQLSDVRQMDGDIPAPVEYPAPEEIVSDAPDETETPTGCTKDRTGTPLPEHLVPAFQTAETIRSTDRQIGKLVTSVLEIATPDGGLIRTPGTERITVPAIQVAHKDLRSAIEVGLPYAVCPNCKGRKCDQCENLGWIHKDRWSSIPKEQRGK